MSNGQSRHIGHTFNSTAHAFEAGLSIGQTFDSTAHAREAGLSENDKIVIFVKALVSTASPMNVRKYIKMITL